VKKGKKDDWESTRNRAD